MLASLPRRVDSAPCLQLIAASLNSQSILRPGMHAVVVYVLSKFLSMHHHSSLWELRCCMRIARLQILKIYIVAKGTWVSKTAFRHFQNDELGLLVSIPM